MISKWRVCKTRSGKRWVAWKYGHKQTTAKIFDTWIMAFTFARLTFRVDYIMAKFGETVPAGYEGFPPDELDAVKARIDDAIARYRKSSEALSEKLWSWQ